MYCGPKDEHYAKIILSKDRNRMYKYKLIKSIVNYLDNYMDEQDIDRLENESLLFGMIDGYAVRNSPNLIRYFTLFGVFTPTNISILDIQDWTFKYKKINKLYYDENDDQWYYGQNANDKNIMLM